VDGLSLHRGADGMRRVARSSVCGGVIVLLCLSMAGCGSWRWPRLLGRSASRLQVVPRTNTSVLRLRADDIVTMMLYVGFTERQTEELGADLHHALMTSGAAEIRAGEKQVEAIFAVRGDEVWIATRRGGTFPYNARSGRFGTGTTEDSRGLPSR